CQHPGAVNVRELLNYVSGVYKIDVGIFRKAHFNPLYSPGSIGYPDISCKTQFLASFWFKTQVVNVLVSFKSAVLKVKFVVEHGIFAQRTRKLFIKHLNIIVINVYILVHVTKYLRNAGVLNARNFTGNHYLLFPHWILLIIEMRKVLDHKKWQ